MEIDNGGDVPELSPSPNPRVSAQGEQEEDSELIDESTDITPRFMTDDQFQEISRQFQRLLKTVAPVPPKENNQFVRMYKAFISLGATRFSGDASSGKTTAIKADYWILECEKIFKKMTLTEVEKCHLAAHHLDKAASDWWYFIKNTIDQEACTWAEFRAMFEARFMPPFIMSQLADDFLTLTQGEMTVMEYRSHFSRLSHYAPDIPQYHKNRIFIKGLSSSSKWNLLPLVNDSFSRIFDLALQYEKIDAQFVREEAGTHSGQGDRHHPYGGTSRGQSNGRGQKYQRRRHRGYQNSGEFRGHAPLAHALPVRPHIPALPVPVAAPAAQPTFTCFRCGDPSHRIRDCPMSDLEHGRAHGCSQGQVQYHGPVPVDGRASIALATNSNVGVHSAAAMHNHYGSGESLHSPRFIKTEYGPTSSSRDRAVKWTCTVCMDQMKEETSTLCGHIFCKSCIIHTIRIQKKCPTCRQDLSMEHIHRIYLPGVPS